MSPVIIDVREKDEFDAEHIENSIFCPMSEFQRLAPGILHNLIDKEVILMCRSGRRAELCRQMIEQMGFQDKVKAKVYEGGILKWKQEGKPVVTRKKAKLPLLRQVQLVIGLGILIATYLTLKVNLNFIWLIAFFGAGLTIAGLTGFCGMAVLLSKLPYNKNLSKDELCCVSPSSGSCDTSTGSKN